MDTLFSVRNVPCVKTGIHEQGNKIVDIREYHESNLDSMNGRIHIPYAYLKRFYNEIPKTQLHVIASDRLELNLGVRFLQRKGFNIVSYELMNCPCI